MESIAEHSRFALALFAITSPLPFVPVFLSVTAHLSARQRNVAAISGAITMFVILSLGFHFGEAMITALGA